MHCICPHENGAQGSDDTEERGKAWNRSATRSAIAGVGTEDPLRKNSKSGKGDQALHGKTFPMFHVWKTAPPGVALESPRVPLSFTLVTACGPLDKGSPHLRLGF